MKPTKIRQYQSAFVCIGEKCEDPCCSGWSIPISQKDRIRLQAILSPAELKGFVQDTSIPQVKKNGASCVRLCSNGLCSLQKEHGHSSLPQVCASYPRFLGVHNEGAEMGGWLSCPEIARLTLVHAQDLQAMEVQERAIQDVDISASSIPYEQDFFEVRGWFAKLWEESTNSKEFFRSIATLVGLSPAFFHRSAGNFCDLTTRVARNSWKEKCLDGDADDAYDQFLMVLRDFLKKDWPYPEPMTLLRHSLKESNPSATKIQEKWIMRYLHHDWNVRWYTHSPNLLFHWQAALFKIQLIRLLYAASEKKYPKERFVQAVYSTERLVEHTPLKRDLYAMYSHPWSFARWIEALMVHQ